MTYDSFLKLVSTLSYYIRIYSISMKKKEFLIEHNIAKDITEANHIKGVLKNYRSGSCSLQRTVLSIICMHYYKKKDICIENFIGEKMHLSRIVEEYKSSFYKGKTMHSRDVVYAVEKFLYGTL